MASTSVSLTKKKRRKGTVYQIDYRVNGKRIREVVGPDRRTAELKRATTQQALIEGKLGLPKSTHRVSSLKSLVDGFLAIKKREVTPSTAARYSNYLTPLIDFFESFLPAQAANVRLIERKHIHEFIEFVLGGKTEWARKTANSSIKFYRSLFKYAVEEKLCDNNPTARVKELKLQAQGKRDFYSDDELAKIWSVVDPHWRNCLEFLALTGLRKGEMINLTWDKVALDPLSPQITVTSSEDWSTKTGNTRMVPLPERAVQILHEEKGKHPEVVFTGATQKKILPDEPYHALKAALDQLGLKGDVHKLRHTYASKLTMSGVDITAVKDLLGHTDIKTTQIYAQVSSDHLKNAVSKLKYVATTHGENPSGDVPQTR
jgi:site-specific recombinase XerD